MHTGIEPVVDPSLEDVFLTIHTPESWGRSFAAEAIRHAYEQPEFEVDGTEFSCGVKIRPRIANGEVREVGLCIQVGDRIICIGLYNPTITQKGSS